MSNASNFAKNIYKGWNNDAEYYTIIKYNGNPYPADEEHSGVIWFNTSEGKLKTIRRTLADSSLYEIRDIVAPIKTWSTAAQLPISIGNFSGVGEQNAVVVFGGYSFSPVFSFSTLTIEYNGTSWSSSNTMAIGRAAHGGAGTQNAALAFGGNVSSANGNYTASTEEYDGTSWASGGNMVTARHVPAGAGTQNAALACGGYAIFSDGFFSSTEEYDGTSWASGGNMVVSKSSLAATGTQNAALALGGYSTGYSYNDQKTIMSYNGTSWSMEGNSLIYGRANHMACGSQTAAVIIGASTTVISFCTEEYNGSSCVLTALQLLPNMNYGAAGGTVTAAIAVSGGATEKYN